MAGASLEFFLMLGYAISLALIALLLECASRHAHRRSLRTTTAGSTYHPDRDLWRCLRTSIYSRSSLIPQRASLSTALPTACNSCRSKAACTDSNHGREIERRDLKSVEFGMKRFHHAMSITLLVLACLILGVEAIRDSGLYPRIILIAALTMFCVIIQRLSAKLFGVLSNPGHDYRIDARARERFLLKVIGYICSNSPVKRWCRNDPNSWSRALEAIGGRLSRCSVHNPYPCARRWHNGELFSL